MHKLRAIALLFVCLPAFAQISSNAYKLRGYALCANAPSDAYVLTWYASGKCWKPAAASNTANVVTGASALTTVGAFPYVSGSGALGQSANLFQSGSFIGIGISSPAVALYVKAAGSASGLQDVAYFGKSNTQGSRIQMSSGDGLSQITASLGAGVTGQSLAFAVWGGAGYVEGLRIVPSGAVGIGTTSPSATLDVNGYERVLAATVSTLKTCSASTWDATHVGKGAKADVTDATAPTYLGTLTGGGGVFTPVVCNGTAWVSY